MSQAFLVGKEWSEELIVGAYEKLAEDLPLPPNVSGQLLSRYFGETASKRSPN